MIQKPQTTKEKRFWRPLKNKSLVVRYIMLGSIIAMFINIISKGYIKILLENKHPSIDGLFFLLFVISGIITLFSAYLLVKESIFRIRGFGKRLI